MKIRELYFGALEFRESNNISLYDYYCSSRINGMGTMRGGGTRENNVFPHIYAYFSG